MIKIPLSKAKDDLSAVLRKSKNQDIIITRHGQPMAVVKGFASDDDWLEYRMLNDGRFLARIAGTRGHQSRPIYTSRRPPALTWQPCGSGTLWRV